MFKFILLIFYQIYDLFILSIKKIRLSPIKNCINNILFNEMKGIWAEY